MDQKSFVHSYVDSKINKFNPNLFRRSDDAIIDQLCKIILSCQADGFFKIKVKSFEVVDDYIKINDILRNYYDHQKIGRSSRNPRESNRYNYIDLKDSDIRLLIVNYETAIRDETGDVQVIIEIPKVVDKFYFHLNGNHYAPLFQIVDGTTYNVTSSKFVNVTMKTNLQPIKVLRHQYEVNNYKDESCSLTTYNCQIFNKTVPTIEYMLARMGYIDTLAFMGLDNVIGICDYAHLKDYVDEYTEVFRAIDAPNVCVLVPKAILGNSVVDHIIWTIISELDSDSTVETIFDRKFWTSKLGSHFSSSNQFEKGINVLRSIEGIYDINIKEQIRLPYEHKKDIYAILRWMVREYGNLRQKDNQEITNKKVRCAEYIAALYAVKLSRGMNNLANLGKRATLISIKKVICTDPAFLIKEISKSQLVSYRNIVTDMDSLVPIKFTYKGISGIGENSSSIPIQFRLLDISNMGILDPDASSPSDPGATGSIVPLLDVKKNGYFKEIEEPLTWETEYSKLYNNYKEVRGLKEVFEIRNDLIEDPNFDTRDLEFATTCSDICERINKTVAQIAMENQARARMYPEAFAIKEDENER